jgi:Spy/CpxP family protein refolding chaperone
MEEPMNVKALLLSAGLLLANGAGLTQQPRPGNDPVGESLFPPELVMQHQKAIGLEETQKSFIRAEISKAQVRFSDLQWQLQDATETLVSLLNQNPVDEQQVLEQLDKVLNLEREIKRTQIGLMVRIKNKMTQEQQARLRELRGKHGRD